MCQPPDQHRPLAQAIDPATPGWLDLAAAVHQDAFSGTGDEGWTASSLKTLLDSPGVEGELYVVGDTPVAVFLARVVLDEAEIVTVGVRPQSRSKGIAGWILEQKLASYTERGIKRVYLEVRESNLVAQRLYLSFGFRTVGVRKNYYRKEGEGRENALVFCLKLTKTKPFAK